MSYFDLSQLTNAAVLRLLGRTLAELAETPQHLYPLLHASLCSRRRLAQEELMRRCEEMVIHADELEYVGDDGTLEDALQRLLERQQD